jgi:hypothetical protein
MNIFSKSIGLLVVSSAIFLGGMSLTQEAEAKPKCLVKGSIDVNSGSGKPSKHFYFTAKKDFKPYIDMTFYGDKKGSGQITLLGNGAMDEGGFKAFKYTTKKQNKTFLLNKKIAKKNKKYELYFASDKNKPLHVKSFCLHG